MLATGLEQCRLVAIDPRDEVLVPLADQFGGLARTERGVGEHDRAGGQSGDHLAQGGVLGLVLSARVAELADDYAGADGDGGELVGGGVQARLALRLEVVFSAKSLAVDGNCLIRSATSTSTSLST